MNRLFLVVCMLFFASCKSETKTETTTENEIDKSVYNLWNDYVGSNPKFHGDELPESWYFHNNKADANRLAELTLNGKKTATTSGLYAWYKEVGADLPKMGTKHIITDFDGKALAIIEIKKVDTISFNQMPKDYAVMDMGTQIEPLKKWRKAHWDFFESIMKERGEEPTEDMLIVFERFEVIWPEKH